MICRGCEKELTIENFTPSSQKKRGYRSKCHSCTNIDARRNYTKLKGRAHTLMKRYRMTLADYDKLCKEANYSCFICKRHQSQLTRVLVVDHCHKTGRIRGVLCNACNGALGRFGEKIEQLQAAIEYLSRK